MRNRVIAVAVILALVVSAGVVVAQGRRCAGKPAGPPANAPGCGLGLGLGPEIVKALKLTPDQIRDLQKLRDECMAANEETRKELQARIKETVQLWMVDQPDAVAIKDKLAELDPLRVELRNACVDGLIKALGVLTAEQRATLREMLKNRPGACMGIGMGLCCPGMGPGGGMGPGPGGCPLGLGGGNATGPRAPGGACPLLNK